MSEAIPDSILREARKRMLAMTSHSPVCISSAIASALMDADEAATKRERARCAALAFSFVGEAPEDDAPLNVYDEAVNGIATAISAAILKGEA